MNIDEAEELLAQEIIALFKTFRKKGVNDKHILMALESMMDKNPPPVPKKKILEICKEVLEKSELR